MPYRRTCIVVLISLEEDSLQWRRNRRFQIGRKKENKIQVNAILTRLSFSVNNHSHLHLWDSMQHGMKISSLVRSSSFSLVRIMFLVCAWIRVILSWFRLIVSWFRLILSWSLSVTKFCVSSVATTSGGNRKIIKQKQINNIKLFKFAVSSYLLCFSRNHFPTLNLECFFFFFAPVFHEPDWCTLASLPENILLLLQHSYPSNILDLLMCGTVCLK